MQTKNSETCSCCGSESCNCNCRQKDTLTIIKARRAVRRYKTETVKKEDLDKILEAGTYAPSALNRQPWKFYVLQDAFKIKQLSEEILNAADKMYHDLIIKMTEPDPVFHGAPAVIFIACEKNDEWSPIDAGLCAQNIMLAAKSLGYDTCPIGFARMVEKVPSYGLLKVSKSDRIQLAVTIGIGDENPEPYPRKQNNIVYL